MRRIGRRAIGIVALVVGAAAPTWAEWLPPYVEEGAAQQLADRFAMIGEVTDREALVEGTRGILQAMRTTIERWGADGTVERAPTFERFTVRTSGNRYLDAMGSYSVCNLLLLRQLESADFADDRNARMTSVLGLSSLTLAILRLREPFVEAGGTHPQIEAYLTGADLEPVFEAIQTDPEILAHAEERCQPVVVESLEEPLRHMAEMGDAPE